MTLHLIKLCVGATSIEDLAIWQAGRLAEARKKKRDAVLFHTTFQFPKRQSELLDGGSLYWVMKGHIRCRQRLLDIESFVDGEGIKRCKLVLDPEIIATRRRERRPFQGWRYFDGKDAPPDARTSDVDDDMPDEMRAELEALGLL